MKSGPCRSSKNEPWSLLPPGITQFGSAPTPIATGTSSLPEVQPIGSGLKLQAQCKDGSGLPVEISLSPEQYEGERRASALVRDVSKLHRKKEVERNPDARNGQAECHILEAIGAFNLDGTSFQLRVKTF